MIRIPRMYPSKILQLEAALRRYHWTDSEKDVIYSQIKMREAGYQGEKRLDYYLSLEPEDRYIIFNNLRLPHNHTSFEIDTILLSPYFILLLDVKNIKGELFFDQLIKQCVRTLNNSSEAINDPIAQSYRHQWQLKYFWKQQHLTTLPIYSQVIISHPTTLIRTNPGLEEQLSQKVKHVEILLDYLDQLRKENPNRRLTDKQLETITQVLLDHHSPADYKILERLNLYKGEFIPGAQCPSCCHIKMIRKYGTWSCPNCSALSNNAHEQAIYDYLILEKPTISNVECRKLLNIESRHLATRLLQNLKLKLSGKKRNYTYSLNEDWVSTLLYMKTQLKA